MKEEQRRKAEAGKGEWHEELASSSESHIAADKEGAGQEDIAVGGSMGPLCWAGELWVEDRQLADRCCRSCRSRRRRRRRRSIRRPSEGGCVIDEGAL